MKTRSTTAAVVSRAGHRLSSRQDVHIVVLGAGGNIGSHLVPLIARSSNVTRLTLVDFDCYESHNLTSQDIAPSDVGQPKAGVQARRARRCNPGLQVLPLVQRLENVPLGLLRANVILACLDSKEARRRANEVSWRLGVPWIDAGIEASAGLARVNVYRPGLEQPCLECLWDDRDYAQLPVRHPCQGEADPETPGTNAPACLGALAAAWQANDCHNLLGNPRADRWLAREVLMETLTPRHFVTTLRRNPGCRFDHRVWQIAPLPFGPGELTLKDALALRNGGGARAISFGGHAIATRLDCAGCGFARNIFHLSSRLPRGLRECPRCRRGLLAAGFNLCSSIGAAMLTAGRPSRTLRSIGLRGGDVFSVSDARGEGYYQLQSEGGGA